MTALNRRSGVVPPDEQRTLRAGLGVLLRRCRVDAGLSARELARHAGVAASTVTRLERGERRPRGGVLLMLARVLAPEDAEALAGEFKNAAGTSLVPDTWRSLERARDGHSILTRQFARAFGCPTCGRR